MNGLEPWERFVMLQRALEDVPYDARAAILETLMVAAYTVIRNMRSKCTTLEAHYAINTAFATIAEVRIPSVAPPALAPARIGRRAPATCASSPATWCQERRARAAAFDCPSCQGRGWVRALARMPDRRALQLEAPELHPWPVPCAPCGETGKVSRRELAAALHVHQWELRALLSLPREPTRRPRPGHSWPDVAALVLDRLTALAAPVFVGSEVGSEVRDSQS